MVFSVCCALLCCALIGSVRADNIVATVGTDVTLPCRYEAQKYGWLPVCWGRGPVPSRGCDNEVISADGSAVSSRLSERYQLLGNLAEGDVSLTIRRVEEGDSGTYGCRVEIPGWFNDHKHETTLTVMAVPPDPVKVEVGKVEERSATVSWTRVSNGSTPITSYRIYLTEQQASWETAVVTDISDPELATFTLVDLHPATTYSLRMFVANNAGVSKSSNVLTVTTKEAARPNPVKVEIGKVEERTITVRWTPVSNSRSPVTSYRIFVTEQQASWDNAILTEVSAPELTAFTLADLRPARTYRLRVFVANDVGVSESSNVLTVTTKEAAPEGPPREIQLLRMSASTIKVIWKPPSPELRNGVLRSYTIIYRERDPEGRPGEEWHEVRVAAAQLLESTVLSNLKPSPKYDVLIRAQTDGGVGPAATATL